jgi:outer membrane lipoprotein-sorting protein
LIGVAVWTGNRFLLAAAIVFNIEALRQFIPLVRLDGYWLLADLTGVPDFFTQIRSFIHSVRPRTQPTVSVPQFKRWVTVVFGLYLLLSIPATVYVVALMLGYLPNLVVLTQQALTVQTQLWSVTQDPLTRALIALQIAFIPLPMAAVSYFLYITLIGVATQIAARYGWNRTTVPVRRLVSATALAAAWAFVAFAWGPGPTGQNAAFAAATDVASIDPTALLRRVQDATQRAQSMQADLAGALGSENITGRLALSRPNRAHVEVRGSADSLGTFSVVSNGEKLFVFFPEDKKYTKATPAADGSNINAFIVDQVRTFFKPERLTPRDGHQVRYAGQEWLEGAVYHVVEMRAITKADETWRYYISPDDYLLRRVANTQSSDGKTSTRFIHLANLRINGVVEEARFQWVPPDDATTLDLGMLGVALPGAGLN